MCWVKTSGGNNTKEIHSIADLLCTITKERGVTELRVVDHDVGNIMKASCNIITSHCFFFCFFSKILSSCNPNHIYCNINSCYLQVLPDGQQRALHYRHKLSPLDKVNALRPKELDPNATRLGIRGAMLGAYWCKKFEKLPLSNWLKVVWEASLNFKTPLCFYHFLSNTTFEPNLIGYQLNFGFPAAAGDCGRRSSCRDHTIEAEALHLRLFDRRTRSGREDPMKTVGFGFLALQTQLLNPRRTR